MIDKYYRGEYEPFNREDFLAGPRRIAYVVGNLFYWMFCLP